MFHANQTVTLLVYGLALLFTTAIYAGWQQFSLMLARGGAYKHLCGPDFTFQGKPCPPQDKALGKLLPIGGAVEIAGELAGGFALDLFGGWQTVLCGEVMNFIALALFGLAPRFQGSSYIDPLKLAMVITGAAINLCYFPALQLRHLFPNEQSFAVSFIIAAQLLAEIVAPILYATWIHLVPNASLEQVMGIYLGFIFVPCATVYIFFMARNGLVNVATTSSAPTSIRRSGTASEKLPFKSSLEVETPPQRLRNLMDHVNKLILESRALLNSMFSLTYAGIVFLSASFLVMAFHYQVILRPIAGPGVSMILGWLMPIDSILSVALGKLSDTIGPGPVLKITACSFLVSYLSLITGVRFLQVCGLVPFIIGMSFAWTAKHVYINAAFSSKVFGRLVGIAGLIGGLAVLILNPILQSTYTNLGWCRVGGVWSVGCLLVAEYLDREVKKQPTIKPPGDIIDSGDF